MNELYLIFVPGIVPETFVLFNLQGDGERFSIRDYGSRPPRVIRTKDLPEHTGISLLTMAKTRPNHCVGPVDAMPVEDNDIYWRGQIRDANAKYLSSSD